MDIDASIEQVAGILVREDLNFETREDGRAYRLLFGSAAVFIEFDPWQDGGVVISVSAPILQDIDVAGPGAAAAMNRLNSLNREHRFLKFTYDDGVLAAGCELLGDTLQAPELLNAIFVTAAAADQLDDALREEVGGKTYEAALDDWAFDADED